MSPRAVWARYGQHVTLAVALVLVLIAAPMQIQSYKQATKECADLDCEFGRPEVRRADPRTGPGLLGLFECSGCPGQDPCDCPCPGLEGGK